MGQTIISVTDALHYWPSFPLRWQPHHNGCKDPSNVAIGNPDFGTIRHVVVVETNDRGEWIRPLYDKIQLEEGPADRNFPGTILVPWYRANTKIHVVLINKERPVRKTNALEFPQGWVKGIETETETGVRVLHVFFKETSLEPIRVYHLGYVCPEPDWFPKAPAVVAVEISPANLGLQTSEIYYCYSIYDLEWTRLIDSATSLAALVRFMAALPEILK